MNFIHGEHKDDPRDGPFHKKIVKVEKLEGYRAVSMVTLECGHQVQAFGNLEHAKGVILCLPCQERDAKRKAAAN